jgi:hypothetical protein
MFTLAVVGLLLCAGECCYSVEVKTHLD